MSEKPIDFYDCDADCERLSSTEPDEAVLEWLDQHEIEFWPDELPVYGWRRMRYEFDAERILANALETADEEHSDPDGDGTEPNEAMKAAARAFADVLDREYVTWACERERGAVARVNVAEWVRANEPAWCEEPEIAAWLASRSKGVEVEP